MTDPKPLPTPLSEKTANTGHYYPARWTCCACYHELGDVGEGEHTCPNCGHRVVCSTDHVPSYITELAESA